MMMTDAVDTSIEGTDNRSEYRRLPAIDSLLGHPEIARLVGEFGRSFVVDVARALLAEARQAIGQGEPAPAPDGWPVMVANRLARQILPTLRPTINATGVIVHTNLGRAPLSQAARQAVSAVSRGYSNLEYDLETGERGSRYDHTRSLLCELTGAEDALVVNNNAGAVYLVLAALCQGQEVVISRGQLVEIGGGFRIPDVLRQSGAHLVEVGTTNRTHLWDYAQALGPQTAALMRVHSSNFHQLGFVTAPELADMVTLAHSHRPEGGSRTLIVDDLGSGTLLDTAIFGLEREPMVQESLAAGTDIVTFSGDKLLGGPQAGLILGRAESIATVRRHPMTRALRVDKMTLAALEATLRSYQRGMATQEIPVWKMLSAPPEELEHRAKAWQANLQGLQAVVLPGESTIGGGSLPGETLPTFLLALPIPSPDEMAARLRQADPPLICRIQRDHLVFDPRTVLAEQETALLEIITRCTP
jgi:L-seryl-tRNA(Ser) seleniumtransferase